jgi:hypothetical protein
MQRFDFITTGEVFANPAWGQVVPLRYCRQAKIFNLKKPI